MDIDDIAAETDALAAEFEKPYSPENSESQIDLVALAESVVSIQQSNKQVLHQISTAAEAISRAPEAVHKGAQSGVSNALAHLHKKEAAIAAREQAVERNIRNDYLLMFATLCTLVLLTLLVSWIYVVPKLAEFIQYRASHTELQNGSVYGARVVEQEGKTYVLFDEGVSVVRKCGQPNCFQIDVD